jgi:RNA recognition motif-containing protein
MVSRLLFTNIPYNCTDKEFKDWVESHGLETRSIRIVRDLVSGVSPAFGHVDLKDRARLDEAITILNGTSIRNHRIAVSKEQVNDAAAGAS